MSKKMYSVMVLVLTLGVLFGCQSQDEIPAVEDEVSTGSMEEADKAWAEILPSIQIKEEELYPPIDHQAMQELSKEQPYLGYSEAYKDKLLPLGSIVYIKDLRTLGMIAGQNVRLDQYLGQGIKGKTAGVENAADYFLVEYPLGYTSIAKGLATNHEDVSVIFHLGMEAEEGGNGESNNGDFKLGEKAYAYLPVGTVVSLRNGTEEEILLIVGVPKKEEGTIVTDFYAVSFAEGLAPGRSPKISFRGFNYNNINEILHMGYETPQSEALGKYYTAYFEIYKKDFQIP